MASISIHSSDLQKDRNPSSWKMLKGLDPEFDFPETWLVLWINTYDISDFTGFREYGNRKRIPLPRKIVVAMYLSLFDQGKLTWPASP